MEPALGIDDASSNITLEPNINVRPLFQLVEDVIDRVTQTVGAHSQDALLKSGEGKQDLYTLSDDKELQRIIDRLSSKITDEMFNGRDVQGITDVVWNDLTNFTSEDKLVLTLVAFVMTFGDFWLLVRIYSNNAIVEAHEADNSVSSSTNIEAYKKQFEANNNFIKCLVSTTRSVFLIRELDDRFISNKGAVSKLYNDCYSIMRSAVAAAFQITNLSNWGIDQYVIDFPQPLEFKNLDSSNHKLQQILSNSYKSIDSMQTEDIGEIYYLGRTDTIKIMRILIRPDDVIPKPSLYHGRTKKKVHFDALMMKHVMLLISGLDIALEDIRNIKHSNPDSKTHEIVWIPVINRSIPWTDALQSQLVTLQNKMPWYSIYEPSRVREAGIEFFRNEWNFMGRPILVVLSPQGKVLNKNAIHMVRIWQDLCFKDTLTSEWELKKWMQEKWNLQLLVNNIDPKIQEWIRDDKYIFLYGGKDMDWIRKFTRQAHTVASALQVQLEMVYVGLSHSKDYVTRAQNMITTENLSHSLPESTSSYFWTRIDSMIYSKYKLQKKNDNDIILQEILRLHNNDEWALLAKGNVVLVHGPGRIALTTLEEFEQWKEQGVDSGYVNQFQKHLNEHKALPPRHELLLHSTENVPDDIVCPDCNCSMERSNNLVCC